MPTDQEKKVQTAGLKLAELIPEIGFDIICRIVPGFAVIGLFLVGRSHQQDWSEMVKCLGSMKWPHVLVGLLCSYLIGSLLHFFGNFAFHWPAIWRGWAVVRRGTEDKESWTDLKKRLNITDESESVSAVTGWRREEYILEKLRNKYRYSGRSHAAVLTKLIAEEGLARSVLIICIGASICSGIESGASGSSCWGTTVVLIALSLVAFMAWLDRVARPVARAFFWLNNKE